MFAMSWKKAFRSIADPDTCLTYVRACILNTHVYLKLYKQNINIRQWNLQSHKFFIVL